MPTPVNDAYRSVNALVNAGLGSLSFVRKSIDGGRISSFTVGRRRFITSEAFEMVVTRGLPE
ncbi:MAG: hypothetical protein WA231_01910 [Methylocella sp.]